MSLSSYCKNFNKRQHSANGKYNDVQNSLCFYFIVHHIFTKTDAMHTAGRMHRHTDAVYTADLT